MYKVWFQCALSIVTEAISDLWAWLLNKGQRIT
jgi:hypothetical protein